MHLHRQAAAAAATTPSYLLHPTSNTATKITTPINTVTTMTTITTTSTSQLHEALESRRVDERKAWRQHQRANFERAWAARVSARKAAYLEKDPYIATHEGGRMHSQ